jgi:MscS family membrane protein
MSGPKNCVNPRVRTAIVTLILLFCPFAWAQIASPKPAPAEVKPEPPPDTLGRSSPRGAVLGFLAAARKGNAAIAALYLNTPLRGADAEALAYQLAVVLDRRLPARLNQLSDKPEGSLPDPLKPDEDLVGTISTTNGDLNILVERVDRGKAGKVWLFSRNTLASIPDVFEELSTPALEKILPEFLVKTRLATIPLFEWLAVLCVPLLYLLTGLLGRAVGWAIGACRRYLFRNTGPTNLRLLPPPIRLLLVALSIQWLISRVGLSLLARQFWATAIFILVIIACTWLLMLLNRWGEGYVVARRPTMTGSAAVLRLARRVINGLLFFAGVLFVLHHFGVNPTAALAGLGVGGIAVALAAQKTLENVIAGISLIADHAVHVGDTLKLGDIVGTVEDVGLRSTRIRTMDRTVVSVPNGQIANMSLETLSARDKYWFHPLVALRYETTPVQLRSIVIAVRELLTKHPKLDSLSVRVNFLRLSASSVDVDVFAYVFAIDWVDFLQIQEELLLSVMDIVKQAGAEIAFPSQTMYLAAHSSDKLAHLIPEFVGARGSETLQDERDLHH